MNIETQFEEYCAKTTKKCKSESIMLKTDCFKCQIKYLIKHINKSTLPTDKVYAELKSIQGVLKSEWSEVVKLKGIEGIVNKSLKQLESKGE